MDWSREASLRMALYGIAKRYCGSFFWAILVIYGFWNVDNGSVGISIELGTGRELNTCTYIRVIINCDYFHQYLVLESNRIWHSFRI